MREACGGRDAECGRRVLICKDSLRVGRFYLAPALPALAPRGSALSFEGCFLNHWENTAWRRLVFGFMGKLLYICVCYGEKIAGRLCSAHPRLCSARSPYAHKKVQLSRATLT
jgi:hypothetical protein